MRGLAVFIARLSGLALRLRYPNGQGIPVDLGRPRGPEGVACSGPVQPQGFSFFNEMSRLSPTPRFRLTSSHLVLFAYSLTDPSIRSVKLLGSWDNFTNEHNMERDSRRHCGQWRACHSFKESGGLKMGETYFYYVSIFFPLFMSSLTYTSLYQHEHANIHHVVSV